MKKIKPSVKLKKEGAVKGIIQKGHAPSVITCWSIYF